MSPLLERLTDRSAKIAVLGQGYVGLAVAMSAVEAGFRVVGYEIAPERVASLREARSYIEDVSDDRLRSALAAGYEATDDPDEVSGFDVAVISVPTPLTEGMPDLTAVEAATRTAGDGLEPGRLVILESTTYPGTTEELVAPILENASGLVAGNDFALGYSPERIDPGNAVHTLRTTPKVVSGIDAASLEAVEAFFGTFVDKTVPVSNPGVAELTKLLENTFRHVNIALVNELARFAADLDVDIWEAIDAASTKPFGFMPFRPGPGVGGHCLPVDPTYLSWRVKRRLDETFQFVELANDVNRKMPGYVVQRIQMQLNADRLAVNGSAILILGVAYKPNTSDVRETPALPIIEQLTALGAQVTAVDPYARRADLGTHVRLEPEVDAAAVGSADMVVLLADHDQFDYEMVERAGTRIFDTRRRFGGLGLGNVEHL